MDRICYWNDVSFPNTSGLQQHASSNTQKRTFNFLQLFRSWGVGLRTLKVLYAWFIIGLLYYGISLATSHLTGSFHRDFVIVKSVEVPSNLLAAYTSRRFGRRHTIAGNVMVASVACLLIAAVPMGEGFLFGLWWLGEGQAKVIRLVLGIVGNYALNMSFSSFTSWTLELYGTDLRALGMGASNLWVRVGGATSPWVVIALKRVSIWAPFVVMGTLGLSCGCVMFTLPETRNTAFLEVSGDGGGGGDGGGDGGGGGGDSGSGGGGIDNPSMSVND